MDIVYRANCALDGERHMNGDLSQLARDMVDAYNLIERAIEPLSVEYILNATSEEFEAAMIARWGDDWKTIDNKETT